MNTHDNKYLKPSDKNAIAYLLEHVEEIRKRIDSGLGKVGADPKSVSAYQGVAVLILKRGLTVLCKSTWAEIDQDK